MSIGSIRLITTQKVLKTWSVKGVNQHYLGSNHLPIDRLIKNKRPLALILRKRSRMVMVLRLGI